MSKTQTPAKVTAGGLRKALQTASFASIAIPVDPSLTGTESKRLTVTRHDVERIIGHFPDDEGAFLFQIINHVLFIQGANA